MAPVLVKPHGHTPRIPRIGHGPRPRATRPFRGTPAPAAPKASEVSPPGWSGTVKAMKRHPDIDNPFALAWSMKNKGDRPHYPPEKTREVGWTDAARAAAVVARQNKYAAVGRKGNVFLHQPSGGLASLSINPSTGAWAHASGPTAPFTHGTGAKALAAHLSAVHARASEAVAWLDEVYA